MKAITILLLALFPFLHTTRYKVQIVDCKKNEIIGVSQGEKLTLTLFNTNITDDKGWDKVCSLLDEAENVSMEIDPSSQVSEKLPVYLFADETLVQEEVMKEGYAYPMIRNPEYTYESRLEKAYDAKQTIAQPIKKKEEKKMYPKQGPLFLGTIVLIWLLMLVWMLYHKKKKHVTKQPENVIE